jgi:hypothetical protein
MDSTQPLTEEQLTYLKQVYNVSTSISQTFKNMLEVAVETNDFEIVKPFIIHILTQCNDIAASSHKKKSSIISLGDL